MSKLLNLKYDGSRYDFQPPEIIGFFSLDIERKQHFDARNLKYLRNDRKSILPLDLNLNFETYNKLEQKLENIEKIDNLLTWLVKNDHLKKISNPQDTRKTFICYRGLLSVLLKTPYENQDDWLICATKFKNLVFLCAFYTDKKKNEIQKGLSVKNRRFDYWGRKFEQYMLTGDPEKPPNVSEPVNSSEEFCSVFRSTLNGKHDLLFGAEMDGIDSKKVISSDITVDDLKNINFIELKTATENTSHIKNESFCKVKSLKWWVQSYLVGIRQLICGERDYSGKLRNIRQFRISDLPIIGYDHWNTKVCMSFLDDFVTFVGDILDEEPDFTTFKFNWKVGETSVESQIVTDPEELITYDILPEWFRKECFNYFQEA